MKNLFLVLAFGIFVSCGNSTTTGTARDSAVNAVDAAQTEQKSVVDSAASAQKNNIDSIRQQGDVAIDSAAKKDSTKK